MTQIDKKIEIIESSLRLALTELSELKAAKGRAKKKPSPRPGMDAIIARRNARIKKID